MASEKTRPSLSPCTEAVISVPDSDAVNSHSPPTLLQTIKSNLAFRSRWSEINGAMGDLGTYLPIVISLTLANGLDLGTTLIFTGFYNIATGVLFGVPMPVQPMKSIAAAAISGGKSFSVPEIMAAGILTSGALFLLGVTGLMQLAYRLIPLSVVRGIQLSQGLSFAMAAVKYVRYSQDFATGKSGSSRPWTGLDGLILAIVCFCFLVVVCSVSDSVNEPHTIREEEDGTPEPKRRDGFVRVVAYLPSAFIVFVLGLVLAIVRNPGVLRDLKAGPARTHVVKISSHAWWEGFVKGAVPQLPLSILNSVIAVCKLSVDLFPAKEFSATRIAVSVGVMNLAGCWFGAMPCCHGAGGLAGQYKFGGRSGGCVALLGAVKMVVGLVLGSSLVGVLREFPVGLLGVLLLFAGIELAVAARDMNSKPEWFVMLVVSSVSLVGSSAALGFAFGMATHLLMKLKDLPSPTPRECLRG